MTISRLVPTGAAVLALAAAAPAVAVAAPRDAAPQAPAGQALYPETVPGAGLTGVAGAQATIQHVVRGAGFAGTATARFRVDLGRSAGKVLYVDPSRRLTFTSLTIGAVRFVDNTATLQGVGLLNRRRVPFTVVGVHNQLAGVDVFRISWNGGAAHGGRVMGGSLFIR
ncbi:MAG: hypothetical protein QOK22_1746 [Gaiellaceae bacterium]|jgi:hypothetical protein|nr:hypothetical protein [Gaiellaceae bacterium]